MSSHGILGRIVARTRERLTARKQQLPLERILASAPTPVGQRSFLAAVSRPDHVNIVAEFKRRSPAGGLMRDDLHPVHVAQAYEVAGAAALSILTEEQFFGGSLDDLQEARSATLLPTLRKDFIVDTYQVWEARIAGADAILLIVAVLSDHELRKLQQAAGEAGMAVLMEVHDRAELERALALEPSILGVNNRNLRTLEVTLDAALKLAPHIPDGVAAVAESGIQSGADIRRLRDAGFDAFLVGAHLMKAPDPGLALESLLADAVSAHEDEV
jgi:indole-3-glycerol phosphate synthase